MLKNKYNNKNITTTTHLHFFLLTSSSGFLFAVFVCPQFLKFSFCKNNVRQLFSIRSFSLLESIWKVVTVSDGRDRALGAGTCHILYRKKQQNK